VEPLPTSWPAPQERPVAIAAAESTEAEIAVGAGSSAPEPTGEPPPAIPAPPFPHTGPADEVASTSGEPATAIAWIPAQARAEPGSGHVIPLNSNGAGSSPEPVLSDDANRKADLDRPPTLEHVRAYEAAALSALAETVRLIGTPTGVPPSLQAPGPALLTAALAELEAAEASAAIAPSAAGDRRTRLLALNEVLPRLRALLDLRERGYLSTAEVEGKRSAILAPLSDILFEI
jgi:hypothetical protein